MQRRFAVAETDRARGPDGLERYYNQQQYQQRAFHHSGCEGKGAAGWSLLPTIRYRVPASGLSTFDR